MMAMQRRVVGSRFGLSLGIAQVEVYASAAAKAAVLEAERFAEVAAGLLPAEATRRPTRLSELLVTDHTSRAGVHAVLRDVAEAQAQLHALQAAAISRLADLQPAQPSLPGARADDPADPDRPDDWVADEVAVVLGISLGSASAVVTKARALMEQLPQVWTALADGAIDVRRAQVLVDALADRKHSAGGGLADDLVDLIAAQGLGWIAEGIGPTPLADRIGGALIAADPAEADRRAERRKRRQNVTSTGQGDGLASLRTELADAADVAEELEVIDALAASMRRGGDERPLGQLRVAAHHQLITRPWETLPDDVARPRWALHLRVDLADLDHLGPIPAATPQPTETTTTTTSAPVDTDATATAAPTTTSASASGATSHVTTDGDCDCDCDGTTEQGAGSGTGAIGGLPVSPVAVAELLARYEALLVAGPAGRVDGGEVWFEIVDTTGRLRAITSPAEARAALRRSTGLGPPPAVDGYEPTAAQIRFVKARDRHCRFPGCHRPAEYVDLDHVIPRNHDQPDAGGPTCITNLVCLCRRHHRLKTHAPGWVFAMDPDGTLHVTPPGGRTRTTRPDRIAEIDMSTRSQRASLTNLLGPTPSRFRSPTPEQRAQRRAAAAERAQLAAEIEAELHAAEQRQAADRATTATPPPTNVAPPTPPTTSPAATRPEAPDQAIGGRADDAGDPPPF